MSLTRNLLTIESAVFCFRLLLALLAKHVNDFVASRSHFGGCSSRRRYYFVMIREDVLQSPLGDIVTATIEQLQAEVGNIVEWSGP